MNFVGLTRLTRDPSKSTINLTKEQLQVVNWDGKGYLLVIAGPGTGKSTTLLERLHVQCTKRHENEQYFILSSQHDVLTQLKNNFKHDYLTPSKVASTIHFLTIHELACQVLGEKPTSEKIDPITQNTSTFLEHPFNRKNYCRNPLFVLVKDHPHLLAELIIDIRTQCLDHTNEKLMKLKLNEAKCHWFEEYEAVAEKCREKHHEPFFGLFLVYLGWYLAQPIEETERGLDHLDDIAEATQLLRSTAMKKNEQILIDEFQDVGKLQWNFIKAYNAESLLAIGDPRQSILSFQDIAINNLNNFNHEPIHLTVTFRFKTTKAHQFLNGIIQSSNIPGKNYFKELQGTDGIGSQEFISLHDFKPRWKSQEFILEEILKIKKNSQEIGDGLWPTIAILSRGKPDVFLQEKLIKHGIKIPIKDRTTRNKTTSTGSSLRVSKIFLCLILAHWKHLFKHHEIYWNNKDDFLKIIHVLCSQEYRTISGNHLTDTEIKKLWNHYVSSRFEDSLFCFVFKNYLPESPEYRVFQPLKIKILFWNNWAEQEEISFSRCDLSSLFRENLEQKRELWKSSLMTKGLWNKRASLVDIYSQIKHPIELLGHLADLSTLREQSYGPDIVRMMNVHQAKGREWDYVFIHEFEVDKWPPKYSLKFRGECDPEEWRILYVAASRAKIKNYFTFGKGHMSKLGSNFK